MSFGEKLRELRNERGLTQAQLGEHLSLSESTISLYEAERRSPDREKLKRIANFFNVTVDYLIDTDIREFDILDALEENKTKLLAGGQPLTPQQRLGVMQILDNPSLLLTTKHTTPILGTIRAGIPLLADANYEGELEIPADIEADFALLIKGDSMVGTGLHEGDYVICREAKTALSGQIVVALRDIATGFCDTTLKYYFRENGNGDAVLRAANPRYEDIPMDGDWRIGGVMVALLKKDQPPYKIYNNYLAARDINKAKWDPVIERAFQLGVKPEQFITVLEMMKQTMKGN